MESSMFFIIPLLFLSTFGFTPIAEENGLFSQNDLCDRPFLFEGISLSLINDIRALCLELAETRTELTNVKLNSRIREDNLKSAGDEDESGDRSKKMRQDQPLANKKVDEWLNVKVLTLVLAAICSLSICYYLDTHEPPVKPPTFVDVCQYAFNIRQAMKPGNYWFNVTFILVICVVIFCICGPVEQVNEWIQDLIDRIDTNFISDFRNVMKLIFFYIFFMICFIIISLYFSQPIKASSALDFMESEMEVLSLRAICCAQIMKTEGSQVHKQPYWRAIIDSWPDIDGDLAITVIRCEMGRKRQAINAINTDDGLKSKQLESFI